MGSGVRVVDRSQCPRTRDTQRTFRLRGLRAQVPSSTCEQQQALLVHCASCGGPGNTGDGIYEDGEWLCGGCIAGLLERANDI